MALTEEKNCESYAAVGTPDADWQELKFGFKSEGLKIIVPTGTLDVSFNGADLAFSLAMGEGPQFDFVGMHVSRLWVKNVSAVGAKVIAWSGE